MAIVYDDEEHRVLYSFLYTLVTVIFAVAVILKFVSDDLRFGCRSYVSLVVLLVGEPVCCLLCPGGQGLILFTGVCLVMFIILPAGHMDGQDRAVLVTGCDSGFGFAVAKKLDACGMTVFAACLYKNGPGALELRQACSPRLTVLEVDITKDADIEAAYATIAEKTADTGLWALVNNAGIWYIAEVELASPEIYRQCMEVNFFGTLKMCQKFLPLIRKTQGRIVNMSSLAAKLSFEGMSPYGVSKAAIEMLTDSLRLEMKKWEVQVSSVLAAGYQTATLASSTIHERKEKVWKATPAAVRVTYGQPYLQSLYENFEQTAQKCPTDLTPVVRAVRSAVLSRRPRAHYEVGRGSTLVLLLVPVLPTWLSDKILHSLGSATSHILPAGLNS